MIYFYSQLIFLHGLGDTGKRNMYTIFDIYKRFNFIEIRIIDFVFFIHHSATIVRFEIICRVSKYMFKKYTIYIYMLFSICYVFWQENWSQTYKWIQLVGLCTFPFKISSRLWLKANWTNWKLHKREHKNDLLV